jgi:uracil-DNA glycosylase
MFNFTENTTDTKEYTYMETSTLKPIYNIPIDCSYSEAFKSLRTRVGDWGPVFDNSKDALDQISFLLQKDLLSGVTHTPNRDDLFQAFEKTPLSKVRVVIIGQDPYPKLSGNGKLMAKGLSFSVASTEKIPSSLGNIFKSIKNDYPNWNPPANGDLTKWADQGVLLLNTCLTCRFDQPDSHSKYKVWMPFIDKIFKAISVVRPNCIYLLWGRKAQAMAPYLGEKCVIMETSHPSGFSARYGFLECGHFIKTNDYLREKGEDLINW